MIGVALRSQSRAFGFDSAREQDSDMIHTAIVLALEGPEVVNSKPPLQTQSVGKGVETNSASAPLRGKYGPYRDRRSRCATKV